MTATTSVTGAPDTPPTGPAAPARQHVHQDRGAVPAVARRPALHAGQRHGRVDPVDPDGDLRAADRALQLRHLPGRGRAASRPRASRAIATTGARPCRASTSCRARSSAPAPRSRSSSWPWSSRSSIGVPLGPRLGLRRRLAGPHPGADHGRAVRVPVPAARDRGGIPALGHDRQRHRRDRDRDHRRLRAAVLQGGASIDARRARIHLHRGGARDGREAAHDHPQVPVRQRDPERAGHRDAERRGRDPDARRPRLPRPRHPAQRGGGVGL